MTWFPPAVNSDCLALKLFCFAVCLLVSAVSSCFAVTLMGHRKEAIIDHMLDQSGVKQHNKGSPPGKAVSL